MKVFMSSPFILLCCARILLFMLCVCLKKGGGEEFNPLLTYENKRKGKMMCVYGKKGGKEFNPPLNTSYENKGLSLALSQHLSKNNLIWLFFRLYPLKFITHCKQTNFKLDCNICNPILCI